MKQFTTDWLSSFTERWKEMIGDRPDGFRYLEVGAYEGRSACFIAETYPDTKLTVIDNFVDNYNEGFEAKYRSNVEEYGDRIRTIKADSREALLALTGEREKYDVAYIDGDHSYEGAKRDLPLVWELLREGGLLFLDDYNDHLRANPFKFGVDSAVNEFFMNRKEKDYEVLSDVDKDYQFYVRKI